VIPLNITYVEQNCKSILHKIDSLRLPFKWGANPYRGCVHSCLYCFARYTHSYLQLDPEREFETKIIVKNNASQILRKELSNPKWKRELVNLGSICDPYQPIERSKNITRDMLKEFRRHRNPLTIATKSDLITRDKDIIADLSHETFVDVVISISSIKDEIRQEIEPRAPSTKKRLKAIATLRQQGIKVGVLLMPIVPFLNDSFEELDALYKAIAEVDTNFVIPGILYLTGAAKNRFLEYIDSKHPELSDTYKSYYHGRSPPKDYREKIHSYFKQLQMKYHFTNYQPAEIDLSPTQQETLDQWYKKEKE